MGTLCSDQFFSKFESSELHFLHIVKNESENTIRK